MWRGAGGNGKPNTILVSGKGWVGRYSLMWELPRPEKYLPSKCSPRVWLPTGKCEMVEQTICTSHCFLSSRVEKGRETQNPNFFHLGLLTGWLLTIDKCRSALFSASQIIQSTPTGKSKEWSKRPGRFRGNSSSGKPEEWSSSSVTIHKIDT